MSFGLNSILKKILPTGLFYRSLIIVAAPTIILQIIITVVFFDSIWIKANKGLTRSLVGELKTLSDIYSGKDPEQIDYLTGQFKFNFDFVINIKEEKLPSVSKERKYSPMDRSLRRELKSVFGSSNYWFDTVKYEDVVEIRVRSSGKIIQVLFPRERIAPSSVRLFIFWIIFPSILLISIAIIFLKNQTKPIVNLAKAAEKFGKGDFVSGIRPSGASEIRKAAYEFDRMAKRIDRHLKQRSEMLSGISHDLRTPLTRLKLQLALLNQKELSNKMSKDIDEMEIMLDSYLQFAKSQIQEESIATNINELFDEIAIEKNTRKLHLDLPIEIILVARKNGLKRCFNNIIENGLNYAKNVYVNTSKSKNMSNIFISDDGPGIPLNQYKNVFKPFFRLDESRNLNHSGVGLGMSIAEDIVRSHGGNIELGASKYKGLLVKISLPL
jgi:two-component system, OmpR family, osmolarity sensor histidine kinase EnvZ|tara:strand:+ start:1122 stop:2441 length:1320 start_codon:yes stop_codon:yes gene_type:complete